VEVPLVAPLAVGQWVAVARLSMWVHLALEAAKELSCHPHRLNLEQEVSEELHLVVARLRPVPFLPDRRVMFQKSATKDDREFEQECRQRQSNSSEPLESIFQTRSTRNSKR